MCIYNNVHIYIYIYIDTCNVVLWKTSPNMWSSLIHRCKQFRNSCAGTEWHLTSDQSGPARSGSATGGQRSNVPRKTPDSQTLDQTEEKHRKTTCRHSKQFSSPWRTARFLKSLSGKSCNWSKLVWNQFTRLYVCIYVCPIFILHMDMGKPNDPGSQGLLTSCDPWFHHLISH